MGMLELEFEQFIKECERIIKNNYYKKEKRKSVDLKLIKYDNENEQRAEFIDHEGSKYECEYVKWQDKIVISHTEIGEWVTFGIRQKKKIQNNKID